MLRSIVFLVFIFLFTSSAQAEFRTFCKHTGSGKLSFYSVDVPCSGKNVKITREQFCEAGGTGVQSEYDQICWKFQSSTESNNSKYLIQLILRRTIGSSVTYLIVKPDKRAMILSFI